MVSLTLCIASNNLIVRSSHLVTSNLTSWYPYGILSHHGITRLVHSQLQSVLTSWYNLCCAHVFYWMEASSIINFAAADFHSPPMNLPQLFIKHLGPTARNSYPVSVCIGTGKLLRRTKKKQGAAEVYHPLSSSWDQVKSILQGRLLRSVY
jgi:hypothetical protein